MVDQMISSQLGSLNTAAPAGPVWREPKQLEQMKDMEEGKKESDELAPMYVEGRTVQLDHQTWRQRAPMLVGGLLLLGLVVVLTQMPGGNTGTPGSQEMVDTKGEMGIAADASPVVQNFSSDEGLTTSIPSDEDDEAVAVGENSSANYTDTETENSLVAWLQLFLVISSWNQQLLLQANYKASCPTLLKLHGACDYDLSVDDKNLQRHTLVRLVCPEQCQIMDRYRKMCPSLLNLEGGCVHDLAIEEKTLPQGTFVRLVCDSIKLSVAACLMQAYRGGSRRLIDSGMPSLPGNSRGMLKLDRNVCARPTQAGKSPDNSYALGNFTESLGQPPLGLEQNSHQQQQVQDGSSMW
eukprot:g19225.t1